MAQSRSMKLFLAGSVVALGVVIALPSTVPDASATSAPVEAAHLGPPSSGTPAPTSTTSPTGGKRHTLGEHKQVLDSGDAKQLLAHLAELGWGRDPFLPPDSVHLYVEPEPEPDTSAPLRLPALTGISRRGRVAMAILDQQIVEPGDATDAGFVVLAIGRGTVTLLMDGEQHLLTLSEGP